MGTAPLPMGTPFDYFGQEAHIDREDELVAQGRITQQELDNRLLLRKVMRQAGFRPLRSEWWHLTP
ncbi:MAG: M15 family metallopeptidase [Alistipes sp.]